MNGSEKQVAWARDIQAEAAAQFNSLAALFAEAGKSEAADVATEIADKINAAVSARWFIDNKFQLTALEPRTPADKHKANLEPWKFRATKLRMHILVNEFDINAGFRVMVAAANELR